MLIGIDFSINSTAITISDGGYRSFFSFIPNYNENSNAFKVHKQMSDIVNIISYEKIPNEGKYSLDQSIKLRNAQSLSTAIISKITPILELGGKLFQGEIRIEGFSYSSKGNSFIDLIIYNTFLKANLINKWGHCINVVSPKNLKKLYTGNGNATKCDMLRTYVENSNGPLREKILSIIDIKDEEFKIPKPIDDIIDSVALVEVDISI